MPNLHLAPRTRPCTCDWSGPDWECPVHGPCQGCHEITGNLHVCDGTCDGLTAETLDELRAAYAARTKEAL